MKKTFQRLISVSLSALLISTLPMSSINAADYSAAAASEEEYTVILAEDSKINYLGVQNKSFDITGTAYRSVYAHVIDDYKENYYIDDVIISPENAADVTYNFSTGEIFIQNVTSDFTITPELLEKNDPESLDVSWEFQGGGIYSEENPAATVRFTAVLKDENGIPVPDTKIYFKSDESEISYTKAAKTDRNGVAEFKYAYGLNEGEIKAELTPIFSTDIAFSENGLTDNEYFNVVLQQKSDLWLTTDQVKASRPNHKDGGVIGVDPNYEYFTGVLHQAAITTDSGEWVTPENGVISGLAPGQYGLRFRERVEGDTIYLYSDYDYFTIDRAIWTVMAEGSEGISFSDEALYAAPGGEVFYYVDVEDGYEITDYSVSKPSYIDNIYYSKDGGYIYIDGITGSFTLNVKAEKTTEAAPVLIAAPTKLIKAVQANILAAVNDIQEEAKIEIVDVYQDIAATNEGTQIAVDLKLSGSDYNSSNVKLYYRLSTSNYSTAPARNFTDNGDGTAKIWFSISASVSAEKVYTVYAEYDGEQTEEITLNLAKKPSLSSRTDFEVKNEKGDRANGSITYIGTNDYENFLYHKQGADVHSVTGTKTIEGLESGTWYVYVAPEFEQIDARTYYVSIRSSSASISVGQDDDDAKYYTVKFVDAAGNVVSEKEYEENTPAAQIVVPTENTETYTDGDKTYSYSWEEVKDVTGDVTYYEAENIQLATKVKIDNVYITSNNEIKIDVQITDYAGYVLPINDYSSIGSSTNGGNYSYSQLNNGTRTFTLTSSSLKQEINTVSFDYKGNKNYGASTSEPVTISVKTPEKPVLEATPDINGTKQGTITVTSEYANLEYYRQGDTAGVAAVPEDKVITGLVGNVDAWTSGDYFVYVIPQPVDGNADYNFVTASDKATIKVENTVVLDEEETVVIENSASTSFTDNERDYVRFEFTRDVPESYVLNSHGILYGTSASAFGNGNADVALRFADDEGNEHGNKVKQLVVSNEYANGTDYIEVYIGSNRDGIVYARGYVIVVDSESGEAEIIYSDVANGSFNSLS